VKSTFAINGDKLRELRERKLVMSQRDLAEKIGRTEGAIRSIERGRRPRVSAKTFRAIADVLGMGLDQAREVLLNVETPEDFDQNIVVGSLRQLHEIPIFDLKLSASHWSDISDIEEVYDKKVIDQGLFRARIEGDCMSPKYKDGKIVEFRVLHINREGIEKGSDYYFQRDDGMATFKRVEKIDDDLITLRAINTKKHPGVITVARSLVVRIGVPVGFYEPIEGV